MKLLKNKLVLLSPLIVIAVALLFSLTTVPSINPAPENMPIAIVNEDQGVKLPNQNEMNMGETLLQNIVKASRENSGEEPQIKWVEIDSEELIKSGLDNREYYGALVIPKDYSQKQASLQSPNPLSPEVKVYVNQGMNAMASNMVGQILNQIIDNVNNTIRTQLLSNFEKQGKSLTIQQASSLVSPITIDKIIVNETGTHSGNGNAPVMLFQPIWMSCLIAAVLLFFGLQKIKFVDRIEKLKGKFAQILIGAVLSLIAGFGTVGIVSWLGLNIPQIADTSLFLAIAFFSFYLMISAILSWIGLIGMPIFIIALFFGAPLLTMAPEFLSSFYRNWIYSWLPFRYMIDGLRELFYFGGELSLNYPTIVLLSIGVVSLIILLTSVLKPNPSKEQEGKPQPE